MSMLARLIIFLLAISAGAISRLRLQDFPGTFSRFVNEDGDEVHLRGFNAVVKGSPWIPSRSFDPRVSLASEDLAAFRNLGMNFIRLGVMWPGVEPAPGVYNHSYLAAIRELVIDAADSGLWVLLDMHQDMGSPKTCGEGIPDWVANFSGWPSFPIPILPAYPTDSSGHVVQSACGSMNPWYLGQGALSTQQTFQNLFTPGAGGGLSSWAQVWRQIALATQDLPGILGFELINEPGVGNTVTDPRRLKTEYAEAHNLQPAYDAVALEIRAVAPEALIFFQPVLLSTGCGFTHAPGGPEYANRSVLAFHHYAYPSESAIIKNKIRDAKNLGTGLFASEFNRPDSQDPGHDATWQAMSSACDEGAVGFGLWEYKPFCDNNTGYGKCITGVGEVDYLGTSQAPNIPVRKALSRPFFPSVGGWLVTFHFDVANAIMVASVNMASGRLTQVFLGPYWLHADSKLFVEIVPAGRATWALDGYNLILSQRASGLTNITIKFED